MSEYQRRGYKVEIDGEDDAPQHVELIVKINGQSIAHVHGHTPGLVAFVAKDGARGFSVEIVEHGERRLTDVKPSDMEKHEELLPWQSMALDA